MDTRHEDIEQQAADWVARLDRGLDADEAAALEAWKAQSTRHAGALARAQAVFAHFDLSAEIETAPLDRARDAAPPNPNTASRRRWPLVAAAASVVLATLVVLVMSTDPVDHYSTMVGEVRHLPLPDGSTLTLNTDTRVEVKMDTSTRHIALRDGEIMLDVARDDDRPFIVDSSHARIEVVGTRFSVRNDPGRTLEVVVLDGTIELSRSGTDEHRDPIRMSRNTRATATESGRIELNELETTETERLLQWREGMLAFSGDTLAAAAEEFARYSRTRIVIEDPAVAERRIVGLYRATDPAGFARATAASLGLEMHRSGDRIYLSEVDSDGQR